MAFSRESCGAVEGGGSGGEAGVRDWLVGGHEMDGTRRRSG